MLVLMVGVIFVGFPISFTLLFLGLVFGYFGLGTIVFDLAFFQTIGMMKEQTLAAVPLFIFMGYVVEQAGLMERLFRAFQVMLAPVRGSLYLGVILTATVFAMATGIVGAAVTVLGIMAAPIMIKSGYSPRLSAGAIAAGGTLGILIPPSVMLVVMGPVINVSVAKLYAAAFGPGFLLAGLYIVYTLARSFLNPALGPPVPKEERATSFIQVVRVSSSSGWCPWRSSSPPPWARSWPAWSRPPRRRPWARRGRSLLSVAYRPVHARGLKTAVFNTMTTSSMVLFLAVASNVFGAIFARLGSATVITNALAGAARAARS